MVREGSNATATDAAKRGPPTVLLSSDSKPDVLCLAVIGGELLLGENEVGNAGAIAIGSSAETVDALEAQPANSERTKASMAIGAR